MEMVLVVYVYIESYSVRDVLLLVEFGFCGSQAAACRYPG